VVILNETLRATLSQMNQKYKRMRGFLNGIDTTILRD